MCVMHPALRTADLWPTQIHKAKAEKQRERILKEQMEFKRQKNKAARERKQERVQTKRQALVGEVEEATKEKE